jgi:4a-hydroxytetrahydrobiopterin dehydratase
MDGDVGLVDWRKLLQAWHARFLVSSFADGARFVSAIASADGDAPEVRLSNTFADVMTADPDLARRISGVAQAHGLKADPAAVALMEVALDTADMAAIAPFWAAVLTGSTEAFQGNDVRDPTGRIANLWFQSTNSHETPRQRFHLDLWLAPEVVPERIEAALAAGGTVAYDAEAPAFTVLADPQGNKVCLCTSLGR